MRRAMIIGGVLVLGTAAFFALRPKQPSAAAASPAATPTAPPPPSNTDKFGNRIELTDTSGANGKVILVNGKPLGEGVALKLSNGIFYHMNKEGRVWLYDSGWKYVGFNAEAKIF